MFEVVDRLSEQVQRDLVVLCRDIIRRSPLFIGQMRNGARFKYSMTSAGQCGWLAQKGRGFFYSEKHPDGRAWPAIPDQIVDIANRYARTAGCTEYTPQTLLINVYQSGSTLGLHQDIDEQVNKPVVSISLGLPATFLVGGEQRTDPTEELTLCSGDVMVMANEHRFNFHGVKRIHSSPLPDLGFLKPVRLNLTVRQVSA